MLFFVSGPSSASAAPAAFRRRRSLGGYFLLYSRQQQAEQSGSSRVHTQQAQHRGGRKRFRPLRCVRRRPRKKKRKCNGRIQSTDGAVLFLAIKISTYYGKYNTIKRFIHRITQTTYSLLSERFNKMPAVNKRDFKKGINADDSRRRREQDAIKIRKEKKEEGLAKRRNMNNLREASEAAEATATVINGEVKAAATVEDIPQLMVGLQSQDIEVQVSSLRNFRRLLSVEQSPPVQKCIDCGAIPFFVQALKRNDSVELQFEAAWALTNIASTDRTKLVVECGAVPLLAALLTSPNADIREQCAWCLGNVAGDGADLREVVLKAGALEPLLQNIQHPASLTLLRNCVWSLSNFCRGKPQPSLQSIAAALPVLAGILQNTTDEEAIIDATWALSYISDGSNTRIQAIVDLGLMPYLVRMLQNDKVSIIVPALRTLGNIVSGNDTQTQSVMDCGVLPILVNLLTHSKKNIRKESCWMLSNIAAGTKEQLNALISCPSLVSYVITQMGSGIEWDVRKEAVWVVSNIITANNSQHIMKLVEQGLIQPLCDLLEVNEAKILMIAMESLDSVMAVGAASNQTSDFAQVVDEAGGLDKLEYLQEHENKSIYEKAVALIEKHFGCEEEEGESENMAPVASGNVFSFGVAPTGAVSKPFSFDNAATNPSFQQQLPTQQATPFYTF